jgi:hypothetical protein
MIPVLVIAALLCAPSERSAVLVGERSAIVERRGRTSAPSASVIGVVADAHRDLAVWCEGTVGPYSVCFSRATGQSQAREILLPSGSDRSALRWLYASSGDLVDSGNGVFYVGLARMTDDDSQIVIQELDSDGRPSSAPKIVARGVSDVMDIRVHLVADGDGGVWVLWATSTPNGGFAVWSCHVYSDSDPSPASLLVEDLASTTIAVTSGLDGGFLLAWISRRSPLFVLQDFDPAGFPFGGQVCVDADHENPSNPLLQRNDREKVVAWETTTVNGTALSLATCSPGKCTPPLHVARSIRRSSARLVAMNDLATLVWVSAKNRQVLARQAHLNSQRLEEIQELGFQSAAISPYLHATVSPHGTVNVYARQQCEPPYLWLTKDIINSGTAAEVAPP